jgi:isopenicillin-N N-acyltransferase-like protein
VPFIESYDGRYIAELQGIAEGAGLDFSDVLTLNLRTEIMFSATVQKATSTGRPRGECTSVAVLPQLTQDGHTLLAQNWDWLIHTRETTIVLDAQPEGRPRFTTVVEAGLLAKTGMNSRGIGLVTNTIVSDQDRGEPGVPYHVVLRSLLESDSISDALARLYEAKRASSANYLLASGEGLAFNAECMPGGLSNVLVEGPLQGCFAHANHFVSPRFNATDIGLSEMPDSFFRLQRISTLLAASRDGITPETLEAALTDHANHPYGVCSHEDLRIDPVDQSATIASLVMDLTDQRLWLVQGNPCRAAYEEVDCSWMHD